MSGCNEICSVLCCYTLCLPDFDAFIFQLLKEIFHVIVWLCLAIRIEGKG